MTTARPETQGAPAGKLAELLATEARLDAQVAAARAEADGLMVAARTQAESQLGGLTAEFEAAAAEHRSRLVVELARQRADLEAATAAALHRFEALSEAEVAQLAEWLVVEVIDPTPAEP